MSDRNDPVWMHNDELDRTIQAVRSQVPFYGAAGWVETDPPPEPEPEPEPVKHDSKPSGRARPRPNSKEHN